MIRVSMHCGLPRHLLSYGLLACPVHKRARYGIESEIRWLAWMPFRSDLSPAAVEEALFSR